MDRIKMTAIQDMAQFRKQGWDFKLVDYNTNLNIYLYKRTVKGWKGDLLAYYEVIKPDSHRQPDGSIIEIYPSTERFGVYGKCTRYYNKAIDYFNNGW